MRQIEIYTNDEKAPGILEVLEEFEVKEIFKIRGQDNRVQITVITDKEESSRIFDKLEDRAGNDCYVVISSIEGTLPRFEEKNDKEETLIQVGKFISISKEELYNDVKDPASLSFNFIIMVVLSSIVAGIGILKENLTILIGAMVIAPFLGPNISLAFATTLGDLKLARKSLTTGLLATGIAIAISVLWGVIDKGIGELPREVHIEYRDIVLALISGFAGVISVLSGQATNLVGVMVAAALLPPLMQAGLLLGARYYMPAFNSFLIFSANIICLNIAGIITFYISGIRPTKWWEKEKAAKRTRQALLIWLFILLLLIIAISFLQDTPGVESK